MIEDKPDSRFVVYDSTIDDETILAMMHPIVPVDFIRQDGQTTVTFRATMAEKLAIRDKVRAYESGELAQTKKIDEDWAELKRRRDWREKYEEILKELGPDEYGRNSLQK